MFDLVHGSHALLTGHVESKSSPRYEAVARKAMRRLAASRIQNNSNLEANDPGIADQERSGPR